jgi:hypothetical protein
MHAAQHKIVKITNRRVHTVAYDHHSTQHAFRFDPFFRTDFLHLGKWYTLYLEDVEKQPVIQYARYIDKDKVTACTDYQQEIDQERKASGISARDFTRERKYLMDQLRKGRL